VAVDRAVLVRQVGHQRADRLRLHPGGQLAEQVLRHPGVGDRGDGVGLDPPAGALDGQHPGETGEAGLGGAVVGLAEVAEQAEADVVLMMRP
jgi:hypothetical protein